MADGARRTRGAPATSATVPGRVGCRSLAELGLKRPRVSFCCSQAQPSGAWSYAMRSRRQTALEMFRQTVAVKPMVRYLAKALGNCDGHTERLCLQGHRPRQERGA